MNSRAGKHGNHNHGDCNHGNSHLPVQVYILQLLYIHVHLAVLGYGGKDQLETMAHNPPACASRCSNWSPRSKAASMLLFICVLTYHCSKQKMSYIKRSPLLTIMLAIVEVRIRLDFLLFITIQNTNKQDSQGENLPH